LIINPTAAIAIAPRTAPVKASWLVQAAAAGNDRERYCLKEVATQRAGYQSDEAMPKPAKAMFVQGSCSEMRAGETSNYLHDKIRAGPVHSEVLDSLRRDASTHADWQQQPNRGCRRVIETLSER